MSIIIALRAKMKSLTGIIGAGPAGLTCAINLVKNGFPVIIFDHKAPWEKPCGGIVPVNVIDEFIDIDKYPYTHTYFSNIKWLAPDNKEFQYKYKNGFIVTTRTDLSKYLFDDYFNHGGVHVAERVHNIKSINKKWILTTNCNEYSVDNVVGADGARSIVRKKLVGAIPQENLAIACGYILEPSDEPYIIMKCLDIEGYAWVIMARGYARAGIISPYKTYSKNNLFDKLDDVLNQLKLNIIISGKYSASVPSVIDETFYHNSFSGDNWYLIGDAAGHTEPIMCEGIYYAFKSGELVARAIINGYSAYYEEYWRFQYIKEFMESLKVKKTMIELSNEFGLNAYGSMLFFYSSRLSL